MHKKWLGVLLGFGTMLPDLALAVGLGEMKVISKPGEPFRAQIALRSVNAEDLASLRAGLASPSSFDSIGVPRAAVLEQLSFSIRATPVPSVLVSAAKPMNEGQLRFLLELEWGNGKLVKEYSLTQERPVVYQETLTAAAPVLATPVTPAADASTEVLISPQSGDIAPMPAMAQPAPVVPPAPVWARVATYGPITDRDNLYVIAMRVRKDESLTLGQVMAALYQANPSAFHAGNPDSLKPGAVLTVPDGAAVVAISQGDAEKILSRREMVPASAKKAAPTKAAKPAPRSKPAKAPVAAAVPAPAPAKPALYISAPRAQPTAKTASSDPAYQELTGQVQSLQETNMAMSKQNELLNKSMQQLSQQLREQQQKLADMQGQAMPQMPATPATWLTSPIMLVLVGTNALALILVFWLFTRLRRSQVELQETQLMSSSALMADPVLSPAPARPVADFAAARSAAGRVSADTGEVDVLEQADLYLTYGRTEQALQTLQAALASQPGRKEVYIKLLDVYLQQGKNEEYLDLAERMRARFGKDNQAWRKVMEQGATAFPGHALFVEAVEAPKSSMGVVDTESAGREPRSPAPAFGADEVDLDLSSLGQSSLTGSLPDNAPLDVEPGPSAETLEFRLDEAPQPEHQTLIDNLNKEFEALDAPASPAPSAELLDFGTTASTPGPVPETIPVGEAGGWDPVGTKLDLARAYIEMGDAESARELLQQVIKDADDDVRRQEAQQLLASVGG